jgi:hypothetical protein
VHEPSPVGRAPESENVHDLHVDGSPALAGREEELASQEYAAWVLDRDEAGRRLWGADR